VQSALVLNATFEPLSVVASRRAACLVLDQKADVIETDGTHLRSATLSIPRPLVVRLRYMVKVPYRRSVSLSRRGVFARDDHRCQYCGALADSIDHVLPRSRGGPHEWENVAAACRPCNLSKRDRTPEEAGMRLMRPCRVPRPSAWTIVSLNGVPEVWKPYLITASA
jgi:5-methylcytosine-specific restriction endonuclease McrA